MIEKGMTRWRKNEWKKRQMDWKHGGKQQVPGSLDVCVGKDGTFHITKDDS
jgi:hypothetical protein